MGTPNAQRNHNNVITQLCDAASGGILVIVRNPLGTDPANVVNVDAALDENHRYQEDASERRHP